MNKKIVRLDSNEVWPLLNVLNDVCYGIHIHDFENIIGSKKEIVIDLMDKISIEENKEEAILNLNDSELNILKKSFEEVFRQIDAWEFETRIGISIQEAIKIKDKITN